MRFSLQALIPAIRVCIFHSEAFKAHFCHYKAVNGIISLAVSRSECQSVEY